MDEDDELQIPEQRCVPCERGLAIFGIVIGTVIVAIGVHTLVMSLREGRTV